MSANKMSANKMSANKIGINKMSANKMGINKMGINKMNKNSMSSNNIVANNSFYYVQGFISLFLILLVMGGIIYQLIVSHESKDERIKHKVDTEIEKKLYY